MSKELAVERHDQTPHFANSPQLEELWLPTDRHLSARGCDQVAQWILPTVRKLLGQ